MKLCSLIALALGTLALLSGPIAAQPAPPSPRASCRPTGEPVPVEWDHDPDGSIVIRFSVDEGVDPVLLAAMEASLVHPALPAVLWEYDPARGINQVGFVLDLPPANSK